MDSRDTSMAPDEGLRTAGAADFEWSHAVQTAIFQRSHDPVAVKSVVDLPELPASEPIPGIAIRTARTMAGLPQGNLAKVAGVTQVMVAKIENGLVRPSAELAGRLRAALEVAGSRFVGDGTALGIIHTATRDAMAGQSRSPKVKGQAVGFSPPAPTRRGPKTKRSIS